jgi:hypothetical protein
MRFLFCVYFIFCFAFISFASTQKDSVKFQDTVKRFKTHQLSAQDSAALTRKKTIADSLTWYFLRPNAKRANPYLEQLLKDNLNTDRQLLSPPENIKIKKSNYGSGKYLSKTVIWFFPAILIILLIFGVIRIVFQKEVDTIFKAFFDNRMLSQMNKEDNVFVSWQFLFLFILFSFTTALFICLLIFRIKSSAYVTQFSVFLGISFLAFLFFGLKIILLRLIGFLFDVQKLVKDYLNIIYLTYFNSLFVLLPATFCLSLISFRKDSLFIWICVTLICVIIAFQFVRITINILLNYRLSKFYLILYLCALEICPILIFSRIINTSL